jgi:hypothetical protein
MKRRLYEASKAPLSEACACAATGGVLAAGNGAGAGYFTAVHPGEVRRSAWIAASPGEPSPGLRRG